MYCHQCGQQLPEEAAYCPACGTKVFQIKPQERSPELVNLIPSELMGFLSQGLPMVSSMFHEWNYLTQKGYGLYGIASAELINAAQRASKEVTLGTELGSKKHFFAELYVGPDISDRESGKMRYTPDVDHYITGIFSIKKYTLLVQIAPILQAAMEYYLHLNKQSTEE